VTCAGKKEVRKYFKKHKLRILMKDTYTDSSDAARPMKAFPNDRHDTFLD